MKKTSKELLEIEINNPDHSSNIASNNTNIISSEKVLDFDLTPGNELELPFQPQSIQDAYLDDISHHSPKVPVCFLLLSLPIRILLRTTPTPSIITATPTFTTTTTPSIITATPTFTTTTTTTTTTIIVSQSREKQNFHKLKKITHPITTPVNLSVKRSIESLNCLEYYIIPSELL